jgi:carbon monoxide dehydrogenase subunit G
MASVGLTSCPGPSAGWARGCAPRDATSAFFVESELEIVGYDPPRRLASRSGGRIRSETTWSLTPTDAGTLVRFSGDYHLPLAMRVLGDRALETLVGAQVRQSIANLARLFETR